MKIKNLCLICAKGKSYGLKNKNLKKIKKKSLFEITCEHIKKSKLIDKVLVSSDNMKILSIARKFNYWVPFIRPKNLCKKLTPEWQVWKHAIKYFFKKYNYLPEKVVVCSCTSPKRDPLIIDKAILKFNKYKPKILLSICETNISPNFNLVRIKNNKVKLYNKKIKRIFNRQDTDKAYRITTNVYVLDPKHILKSKHIFDTNKVNYIKVSKYNSLDIDDDYDFEIAKKL